jgi:hypothetical protein
LCHRHDDPHLRLKAIQLVLDRTGFGPKTTVKVERAPSDLADMPTEEVVSRVAALLDRVKQLEAGVIVDVEPVERPEPVYTGPKR